MSPHNTFLFWRTLGMCGVVLGVVTGVVLATDEAYSTTAMRMARLCAFGPLMAAVAASSCLGIAARRGELRALAALGASPWGAAWGALCAAWVFGAGAALLLLTPWADVGALFPRAPISSGWLASATSFTEPTRGLVVDAEGTVRFVRQVVIPNRLAAPGGLEAVSTILPQALVLPAWLVAPMRLSARVWSVFLSAAFTLLALHAAALGQLPRLLLPLVTAPLGVQLAFTLERSRIHASQLQRRPSTWPH